MVGESVEEDRGDTFRFVKTFCRVDLGRLGQLSERFDFLKLGGDGFGLSQWWKQDDKEIGEKQAHGLESDVV